MNNEEFLDKINNILDITKDKKKRLKLLAVKRSIVSLNDFIKNVENASLLLVSDSEVDWFYDKFKEFKKRIKR